ncbi:MAG: hypothetical protein ACT4OU_07670 [Hyphomicrobium sp.]
MTTRSPTSPLLAIRRFTFVALAASAAAIAGVILQAATSETAIRKSFTAALETTPMKAAPLVGTEEYWLSALRPDGPAPVTKTVAVGDRIVMTLSGAERTFLVASVAEFSPEITAVDTSSAPTRFVLVTARDAKNDAAKPIRFVMEIEGAPETVATRRTDRAL